MDTETELTALAGLKYQQGQKVTLASLDLHVATANLVVAMAGCCADTAAVEWHWD